MTDAAAGVGVAVIGAGSIGAVRARTAAESNVTALRLVIDTNRARAAAVASAHGVDADVDWRAALSRGDIGAVVICTPNALLVPIGVAALRAGRHVLIEKPMGRNATEGRTLATEARRSGSVLKVGFNHRYRPALVRAYEIFQSGAIGRLLQMRALCGHAAPQSRESEWRSDAELAGGGELLDQGVNVVDLFHWFAGPAVRAQAELQSAVWQLGRLEDNAFGILRFGAGVVGQFHVSMTEWQPRFSLEIQGDRGIIAVDGLGGEDGIESLTLVRRDGLGPGRPAVERHTFADEPSSWSAEWADFAAALQGGRLRHGSPEDGLQILATVDALYAAARSGSAVGITPATGALAAVPAR